MAHLRPRPTYANVAATLALFFSLAGGTLAAVNGIPGKDGAISGCFQKKGGSLRVVKAGSTCKKGEQALSWNQTGQKGDSGAAGTTGATGAAGSNASVNGVNAGGSLAGTYPSPTLANGSVSTSAFGTIPSARVNRSTSQATASGGFTAISFNTEVFDNGNLFSVGTPTRLTAPTAGTYLVNASITWESSASATDREVYIYENGDTSLARVTDKAPSSIDFEQNLSTVVHMTAGTYVELQVLQLSGGSLNVIGGLQDTPVMSMVWEAP